MDSVISEKIKFTLLQGCTNFCTHPLTMCSAFQIRMHFNYVIKLQFNHKHTTSLSSYPFTPSSSRHRDLAWISHPAVLATVTVSLKQICPRRLDISFFGHTNVCNNCAESKQNPILLRPVSRLLRRIKPPTMWTETQFITLCVCFPDL